MLSLVYQLLFIKNLLNCTSRDLLQVAHVELWSSVLYEVCCTSSDKCGEHIALYRAIVYYSLPGSTMGCSLRVTRAGVAG